jgi:hypothetical protein
MPIKVTAYYYGAVTLAMNLHNPYLYTPCLMIMSLHLLQQRIALYLLSYYYERIVI